MTIRTLFPTRLYQERLPESGWLEELEDACWMLEDGDQAGHAWCEEKGYPGYTSYASLDDLPSRASIFEALAAKLEEHAWTFAQALHWDMDRDQLSLDALWVNILGEAGHHSGHIHPGSIISGTVYITMPDGAGDIRFEDPRLGLMMAAPAETDAAPEEARRFVYVAPKAGDVLMWESWLRHEVMPSRTEEARISVSFNFGLKR
ncbi:TIGR02466 family protein [Henriciella sp.]|uniref:TIGR02466 family protein n=1 Tax=Henriciella sp. TaxID=1968823 RepID=UPI0026364B01|nr:TIGR02466 family protein [Henriciella sp.]